MATQNIKEYRAGEFWQPPATAPEIEAQPRTRPADTCARCDTPYVMGSRFCYVCGGERDQSESGQARASALRSVQLTRVRQSLGLTVGATIAFFAGLVCLTAALAVGSVYEVTTLVDWQAVQLWRLQWMVAAIVMFSAGILLNKRTE
jgi:hypothetical protein